VLVEVLAPYKGRVYDPCCGSGGMFVQSADFIKAHKHNPSVEISVYGQERTFVCSRILRAYDQTSPVVLSKHAPADVEKWKRCPTAFARDDASLSLSCQPSWVA